MRIRSVLLALAVLTVAACDSDPDPLEGRWLVHRSAHAPQPGCDALVFLPDFVLELHPGDAEHPMSTPGAEYVLMDYGQSIDGEQVHFVTGEIPFASGSDTVNLGNTVELVGGQLRGTASGGGDGANLGCVWDVDVVATRAPDATP